MQMQHLMVGYPKYYQTADYALRLSVMADMATMRMKTQHFWDKHGISAASEAFGVSCRTLYWWRQLLNKGGPEGLIPHSKTPLVRRKKHWHPDVLKEIRRLRTELPNLGKVKWHTEFGHLNRGDMLTSEQHRCFNEKRNFSAEFKRESAQLVVDQNYTVADAAKAMDVGLSTMTRWVKQLRDECQGKTPKASTITPEQIEIRELRKKLQRY